MIDNKYGQRTCFISKYDSNGNEVLTSNKVIISITNTLPLTLVTDEYLNILKTTEITNNPKADLVDLKFNIVDRTTKGGKYVIDSNGNYVIRTDRFTYITDAQHPIGKSSVRLYYDVDFKDIIVIPSIFFGGCDELTEESFFIKGYRIGGGQDLEYINDSLLPADVAFELPLTNGNIKVKSYAVVAEGLNRGNRNIAKHHKTYGGNTTSSVYTTPPMTFIELGTMADLFTTSTPLPLYSIFQDTHNTYNIKYIGSRAVSTSKLYIMLSN